MSEFLKIGNIEVEKGTKKSGLIKVAERSLFSINLPITILNGIKPGPILCISAGQHSCEYTGIETCIRLSKNLNPREMNGAVIILPVLNILGFQARVPYYEDAMASSRLYSVMTENLFNEVIAKSNYWINFHGGELMESMPIPYVMYGGTGEEEVDEISKGLAKCFDVEYLLERSAPLEVKPKRFYGWMKAGDRARVLAKLKIPSIVPEAGHEGKLEEKFVTIFYKGAINVLKHLEMIEGKPTFPTIEQKIIRKWTYVTTERGGLFYSNFKVGDIVSKGEILGELRNIRGEIIKKIIAPMNGMILLKVNTLPWDIALGGGANLLFLICEVPG